MENLMNRYPRNVNVNFRKLDKITLMNILRHYKVDPKKNMTQMELAIMTARIFEMNVALEEDVVDRFAEKFCRSGADSMLSVQQSDSPLNQYFREPACPGEQVAAKVPKPDDDGTWILGNVLSYDPLQQTYVIQDEDDVSRIMNLSFFDVRKLLDNANHLRRGDVVLAVFPETTSFYRAVVAKNPKNTGSNCYEVVVKFDDDEDESGKIPSRRVPSRFVLRRSDVEDEQEESEEED